MCWIEVAIHLLPECKPSLFCHLKNFKNRTLNQFIIKVTLQGFWPHCPTTPKATRSRNFLEDVMKNLATFLSFDITGSNSSLVALLDIRQKLKRDLLNFLQIVAIQRILYWLPHVSLLGIRQRTFLIIKFSSLYCVQKTGRVYESLFITFFGVRCTFSQ